MRLRLNALFVIIFFPLEIMAKYNKSSSILCDLNAAIQFEPLYGWNCSYGVPLSPVCDWFGISCSNNEVTEIMLSNRKIKGTLPTTLGGLSWLTSLVMLSNCLSGLIPSSLGLISTLKYINLNSNMLSKMIPTSLGLLTKMTNLVLYNNKLTGTIPSELTNAVFLGSIYLNGNSLTGSLPPLTGLASLFVQSNSLTGVVPSSLCNSGLQYIDISSNKFSCYSSCLSSVLKKTLGGVSSCNPSSAPTVAPTFQDKVMCKIAAALSVITTSSSSSGSSTTIVQGWKCLYNISPTISICQSLDPTSSSSSSQWTGVTCNSAYSVTSISLVNIVLTGSIPPTLSQLSQLTSFTLKSNSLYSTIPVSLGLFFSLSRLEITNNSIYGKIPSTFGSNKSLSLNYISLTSNSLTGSVPSSLCGITSLSYLNIANNPKITCYESCLSSVTTLITTNRITRCPKNSGSGSSGLSSIGQLYTLLGGSLAGFFILLIFLVIVFRVYLVPHRVTPLENDIIFLPVCVESSLVEVTPQGIMARTIDTDDQFFARDEPITLAEPIGILVVQAN